MSNWPSCSKAESEKPHNKESRDQLKLKIMSVSTTNTLLVRKEINLTGSCEYHINEPVFHGEFFSASVTPSEPIGENEFIDWIVYWEDNKPVVSVLTSSNKPIKASLNFVITYDLPFFDTVKGLTLEEKTTTRKRTALVK